MQEIMERQKAFFNTNVTKSIPFRIQALQKLKQVLQENEEKLDLAIYVDFKKSSFENYITEISLLYNDIDEAIKKLHKWAKPQKVKTNLVNFPAKSYVIPEPLGVSLIIGAWNYPYQLSFAPVIPAIAAGNTVVLKPSEIPSQTSKVMAQLINENFNPEHFTVVEGGVNETTELLNYAWDKIFFTGSTTVGKIVYKAAAEHLTPVTLELGGKSPAIITESTDLKVAVKRLVWAKFLNSGQTCIAPDYVVVHKSVEDEFLKLVKREIEQRNYAFENGNYIQIVNEKNFNRLIQLIDEVKIYCGGKNDLQERYIEPTVLNNVSWSDTIMEEEIFGPLLPVISYANLDETIRAIKMKPKPLSCYIFTTNDKEKEKLLNEISFGGGAVNDALMHITNSNLPFGGVGNSGMGNYHGKNGFKTFSHYKSILEKKNWMEPNLKYSPYSEKKLSYIKRML